MEQGSVVHPLQSWRKLPGPFACSWQSPERPAALYRRSPLPRGVVDTESEVGTGGVDDRVSLVGPGLEVVEVVAV